MDNTTSIPSVQEDKSARFHRLATKRVSKALKEISLVENLSNTGTYSFTQAEVDAIFAAVDAAVEKAKASYSKSLNGRRSGVTFSF